MDNYNSERMKVGSLVRTKVAHVAKINRCVFYKLLQESENKEMEIHRNVLNRSIIFRSLSQWAQNHIIYECDFIKYFNPGDTLVQWHPKSRWNTKGFDIYRKFKPEILGQEEAKDNHEKIANIRKVYKNELTKNGK